MVRISSRITFVSKRVFPWVWFGFLALFVTVSSITMIAAREIQIAFLLVPGGMTVFNYLIMKTTFFNLADEVWDAGEALVIKNGNQEDRVPLSDIVSVSAFSPARATIQFGSLRKFGTEITFVPVGPWRLLASNPVIDRLLERVAPRGANNSLNPTGR